MNRQRDRLVEVLKNMPPESFTAENIADYLLENGVIMPPCKLGDTIYEVAAPMGSPFLIKGTVCAIHVSDHSLNSCQHKREDYIVTKNRNTAYVKRYKIDKFGHTLFTNYDEAKSTLGVVLSE